MASDLTCSRCKAVYEAGPDEPWRCECGHPLEFVDQMPLENDSVSPPELTTNSGLWAFHKFIPVEKHVTFHEGFTPLVNASEWNAQFKLEYVFPTGSFKDRGATTTLSRAVQLGVEKVIEDSSGNAGAAIATYAARAGIEADIYVPADVKRAKLRAIQCTDAQPVKVAGTRQDVTTTCIKAVEGGEGWYASHAWNPAFYAGTMTFAFELAAQRDWTAPDAIVLPIGHGTLFLGAYRGFSSLHDAGIIDDIPRLFGAQASGTAPIVDAFRNESGGDGDSGDIADGIRIPAPARKNQILDAINATNGDVIALRNGPIKSALDRLHQGGFYVEPTCAVAPAALQRYREEGVLDENEDIVVPLTGTGLKMS